MEILRREGKKLKEFVSDDANESIVSSSYTEAVMF